MNIKNLQFFFPISVWVSLQQKRLEALKTYFVMKVCLSSLCTSNTKKMLFVRCVPLFRSNSGVVDNKINTV